MAFVEQPLEETAYSGHTSNLIGGITCMGAWVSNNRLNQERVAVGCYALSNSLDSLSGRCSLISLGGVIVY